MKVRTLNLKNMAHGDLAQDKGRHRHYIHEGKRKQVETIRGNKRMEDKLQKPQDRHLQNKTGNTRHDLMRALDV